MMTVRGAACFMVVIGEGLEVPWDEICEEHLLSVLDGTELGDGLG